MMGVNPNTLLKAQATRQLETLLRMRVDLAQAAVWDFTTENSWFCLHLQRRGDGLGHLYAHVHYYPVWNRSTPGRLVGWHTDSYARDVFAHDVDPAIQAIVTECIQTVELQYRLEGKWA